MAHAFQFGPSWLWWHLRVAPRLRSSTPNPCCLLLLPGPDPPPLRSILLLCIMAGGSFGSKSSPFTLFSLVQRSGYTTLAAGTVGCTVGACWRSAPHQQMLVLDSLPSILGPGVSGRLGLGVQAEQSKNLEMHRCRPCGHHRPLRQARLHASRAASLTCTRGSNTTKELCLMRSTKCQPHRPPPGASQRLACSTKHTTSPVNSWACGGHATASRG